MPEPPRTRPLALHLLDMCPAMPSAPSISATLLLLATAAACDAPLPPPPVLRVTSPARGLVQGKPGPLTVTGRALPGAPGDRVTRVVVNQVPATLAPDGSFTAVLDTPRGALLLETVATSDNGASAVDARAVQSGELRPVGSGIDRAITAALSADAFSRLSATAGPVLRAMNIPAMLAPLQPMVSAGDDLANVNLSMTDLRFGDLTIALAPADGGLSFSAEFDALEVTANAAYAGVFVPRGSTAVNVAADQITIAGTLVVSPAGTAGFTTRLPAATVRTVGLRLQAPGMTGPIVALLDRTLGSMIDAMITQTAERTLEPLVNQALGALSGPQQIDVLGHKLDLQASPSAVSFTRAGALVTMNVQARLEANAPSPGYVFTSNGVPVLDASHGFQLGLANDLVNQLLAQAHASGLLDLGLQQDFGVFDSATFSSTLPPMIASARDGALRLVIGDLIATFSSQGKTVVKAAINAQVDLQIAPADNAREVALQFGAVDLQINLLDDPANPDGLGGADLSAATSAGVAVQLDSLKQLLITLPVPSIAGIQLEHVSIGADNGYVMVSGEVH
jgi:hypothetical protein